MFRQVNVTRKGKRRRVAALQSGGQGYANTCVLLLICLSSIAATVHADDFTVLSASDDAGPVRQMVSRYLKQQAYEAFDRRRAAYESLQTAEDIAAYQSRLREFFVERLSGFPERTPLNAQVIGSLNGDGFRVEKIIFESRPRHFVTGNLYLPLSAPPYPAVLVPCGHTANGKAGYQRPCILLAQNGMAAFCYDPIGQGERYQMLDADGRPRFPSTTEHTLVGIGSILVGRGTASYRVWDGIRALDYLTSRGDIDSRRLGCTGISGGGTLTEYLMALDPRIACAAPGCCVTTFQRRLETIGPGDAEQNIFGQIAFGMDHADYTIMRAPRPTLLLAATQDFVDIQGSWDIFRETKRLYSRMGFAERLDLLEADEKHGFTKPLRESAARWMSRWLLEQDQPIVEPETALMDARQLQCTPQGQVQLLDGARSVMDLNLELAEQFAARRRELWQPANREKALDEVRRLAGIRKLADLPAQKPALISSTTFDSYRLEKLVFEPEPGIQLPALLWRPAKPNGRRYLYLHGDGKHADAQPGGPIEELVSGGGLVLAVDLRGCGETGPTGANVWGGNWSDIFLAYLLGKSMLGMRAEDVLVCSRYLSEIDGDAEPAKVNLIAIGVAGAPALHAAALEPQLFTSLKLSGSTDSWLIVVRDPTEPRQLVNTVHNALSAYDLTDLVQSLSDGRVNVERLDASR
jgi:dienelactone hydrolase